MVSKRWGVVPEIEEDFTIFAIICCKGQKIFEYKLKNPAVIAQSAMAAFFLGQGMTAHL